MRSFSSLCATLLALTALCATSQAQDCEYGTFGCGHHENHDAYKQWFSPKGASCCSGEDCRPVRARQRIDGDWEIWIPEVRMWLLVAPDKLDAPDKFKDGRSHACTSKPGNSMMPIPIIYCFSPGQVRG